MKKILFYGNCQLGALSKHIRDHGSSEYKILDCKDYGLKQFWADPGLFATWSLENRDYQDEYYPKIIQAVKDCDIFIFQHHKDLARRFELTTPFLINELDPRSIGICIPSFQYNGYLYHHTGINFVIKKLYDSGKGVSYILDYLKYEDDMHTRQQMIEEHNTSLNKLKEKDKQNKEIYKNYIEISDFIESNYNNKIIAYDHSHPSTHYYNEIIRKLADYDIKINKNFDDKSMLPGSTQLCPYDLKYFNKHFDELEETNKHDRFFMFRLDEKNIQRQIDLIKKRQTNDR